MLAFPLRQNIIAAGMLLLLVSPGLAQAAAGHFLFVHGKVSIAAPDGTARQAAKGMAVEEGETISSGIKGAAQLRMTDGAFLAVRPNTVLRIDNYAYQDKGRTDRSTLSLLKGTFRAITGKIGKAHPDNDLVKTPVATIGIRGTIHEPAYIPPPPPGMVSEHTPGAYDRVIEGRTYIKSLKGTTLELDSKQIGYVPNAQANPEKVSLTQAGFYSRSEVPAVQEHKKESDNSGDQGTGDESTGSDNSSSDSGSTSDSSQSSDSSSDSDNTSDSGSDTGSSSDDGSTTGDTGTDTSTSDTSTGTTSTSTGDTTTTTTTTDQTVTQTYTATSSSSDQTVDLTNQTVSDSVGNTSSIGTITYATPSAKDVAAVSWATSTDYRADGLNGQWGDTFSTDSSNNLVKWKENCSNCGSTEIIGGELSGISNDNRQSVSGTDISYGYYDASSFVQTLGDNSTQNATLSVPFTWISGSGVSPAYVSMAYHGAATFTLSGGYAFDESGNSATLSSGSVSVNFNQQSVDLSLTAITASSVTWSASAIGVPLDWNNFEVWDQSQPSALTVTYGGGAAFGEMKGALSGDGITSLITSFAFQGDGVSLNGVAAYSSSTSISTSIDHRWIGFASYDPRTTSNTEFDPTVLGLFANNTADITGNDTSGLTSFEGTLPYYYTAGGSDNSNNVPVTLSGTVVEKGTDSTTGISWGRWSSVSATASSPFSLSPSPYNPGSLHYIAGPTTNSAVQLPTSGTYSYTYAGGTSPTDNNGNVGTLNSASLTANFTNMTVDLGVNATVNGTTLAATGTGVNISGTAFYSGDSGSFSVTCSGTCSGTSKGGVGGAFTGSTGNGAAMVYSLENNNGGTVISGVAAFHR